MSACNLSSCHRHAELRQTTRYRDGRVTRKEYCAAHAVNLRATLLRQSSVLSCENTLLPSPEPFHAFTDSLEMACA